jgi:hypothetical protein
MLQSLAVWQVPSDGNSFRFSIGEIGRVRASKNSSCGSVYTFGGHFEEAMNMRTSLRIFLAGLVLAIGARPASADSIVLTPDLTGPVNLAEGQSLVVHFTAVINTSTLLIISSENSGTSPVSGDLTDALQSGSPSHDSCYLAIFTSAGNGTATNTCALTETWTPQPEGGSAENNDSGSAFVTLQLDGGPAIGTLSVGSNVVFTTFTVTDVPEPPPMVLIGSGLVGMLVAMRKRIT